MKKFVASLPRVTAMTHRTMLELLRDPLSWIFALALPLGLLGLFTLIDTRIPPEAGVEQFRSAAIGPGMLIFSQSFLTLFVSLLVSGDRDSAFLTRLQVTPATALDFHLGYGLPGMLLGLAQGLLTMGSLWLLTLLRGDALSLGGCLVALVCGLPGLIFVIGLGILLGSLLSPKAAPGIASVVITVSSFLGGCWMDITLMGDGFVTVCELLPWYPAVRMGRAVLGLGEFRPVDILVCLGWAVCIHVACLLRTKKA